MIYFDKLYLINTEKLANLPNDIIKIAIVCHEVNRAYCASIGDNSQLSWEDSPKWQRDSAIAGVNFHMENPEAGVDSSHLSWYKQKESEGWVYGEVKDLEKKTHPCMVEYTKLPSEQQSKDYIFRSICHAMLKNI